MPINNTEKGTVRRSQLITTYGVGSIVAVGDESVMIAGIDRWDEETGEIHEPRLERQLGVRAFYLPPDSDSGHFVPVVRFPEMHYCPSCHRLNRHKFFTSFADNRCNRCNRELIPSRFVVVCNYGHIDDFPYFEWVHAGRPPKADAKHDLQIRAGGVSASLRDIEISCTCGVPARTMQGAFGRDALKGVKHCTGKRPWLGDQVDCAETPRTLQRGATNVYFSIVRSALSIPPWSEGAFKVLNRFWTAIRAVSADALPGMLEGMRLADRSEYSVDDLVAAVSERKRMEESGDDSVSGETNLRSQEYDALVRGKKEASREQEFVCVASDSAATTAQWFDKVMLVKRLREVRALCAFSRLLPPSPADPPERRAPLYKNLVDWLPAVEVLGEGVFLRLNLKRLAQWEALAQVKDRAARIDRNYIRRFKDHGTTPDRQITPRLVLIHTLAHVLITEWSLTAGYPAAALRERLYVSEDMAGLLIYTATSDAAGSLGGVVAQAEGGRLAVSLEEAVERAAWCSADPLCIEADAAGVDALNLAACHACVLLPEVSCEESNVLLDRALLVGTPADPALGFFAPMLTGAAND